MKDMSHTRAITSLPIKNCLQAAEFSNYMNAFRLFVQSRCHFALFFDFLLTQHASLEKCLSEG